MITEDYVSFEIAKLLKEKGFNEKCQKVYMHNGQLLWAQIFMEGESFVNNECIDLVAKYNNWTESDYAFLCPTLQMTMKWLREVYYLHITVHPGVSEHGFVWTYAIVFAKEAGNENIYFYKTNQITTPIVISKSYEQACEAAIKYCLEKLI